MLRLMKYFSVVLLTSVIHLTVWSQPKEIHIFAVNDMHASIDRFPQFVALVDSMRIVYPDLLLFSGGDNRTGNPANDMHKNSAPMVTLMNRAGFNLSLVGNHEFDGDVNDLRSVINNSDFKYVCANMYAHDSLRLHVIPYRMFDVTGTQIAVIGLLQTGANGKPDVHPDNVKNVSFRKWENVAEEYIWLCDRCDVFILLVHEEYTDCVAFLNQYPYPDVLIGAHTHLLTKESEIHNGVLITQAESHLKYVTHITLQIIDGKVTNKESRHISITSFPRKDPEVQTMVDGFNNNEALQRVLTEVTANFDSYEELGYMMTDALRVETGADIALQNPGGVRFGTFPKGAITVRDVYRLDPFNNEAIIFNLTGEEVLQLIKAAYFSENKKAPYMSGVTYEMKLDKQGEIKELQVKLANGSKLNLQKTYKVVMNSYIAAVSKYEKADPGQSLYHTTAELIIQYLEKQPAVEYQGIKRMKIVN